MKDTIDLVTIHETFFAAIDNLNSKGENLLEKANGIDNRLQQLNHQFDAKVENWSKDIEASMMNFSSRQESTINDFDTLWHSELSQQIVGLQKTLQSEYKNFKKDQLRRWELFIDNEKKLFEEKSKNYRDLQEKSISEIKYKLDAESEKLLSTAKQSLTEKQSEMINSIGEQHSKAVMQLEQKAARGQEQIEEVENELLDLMNQVDEKSRHADKQLIQLSKRSQEIDQDIEAILGVASTKVDSMIRDLTGKYENMFEKTAGNFAEIHIRLATERENELGVLKAENKKILDKIEDQNTELLKMFEEEKAKRIEEFRVQLESQVPEAMGPFEVKLKDHIEQTSSKITATANKQDQIKSDFDDKLTNYQTKIQEVLAKILGKKEQQLSLQFKEKFENLANIMRQNNIDSTSHFKGLKLSLIAAQNEIKKAKRERRLLVVLIFLTSGISGFLFARIALGL